MGEIIAAFGLRRDGQLDVEHVDGRKEVVCSREMDRRGITVQNSGEVKMLQGCAQAAKARVAELEAQAKTCADCEIYQRVRELAGINSALEAACAAMRSVMADAKMTLQMLHPNMNPEEPCNVYQTWNDIKCILSSDTGRAFQERMAKLEDIIAFCKSEWPVENPGCNCRGCRLARKLAALEGGTSDVQS